MSGPTQIFMEDEVCARTARGYKVGLVVESSEYMSSEDEDDDFDEERVKQGMCRVAWHPGGMEEVVLEERVKLVDRSLMPGDVVRRFTDDQDSPRGYVRTTKVACHLQILGQNKVICDVPSDQLTPMTYWDTDPGNVVLDSWIGKIEAVSDCLTLTFNDGARCQVTEEEELLLGFEDVHDARDHDTEFSMQGYYPGQRLRGHLNELTEAKWLNTTKVHSHVAAEKAGLKEVTITVEKVEPQWMDVHWLCRGYTVNDFLSTNGRVDQPHRRLLAEEIKRLKKMDCFEACSVQLGDKCFYTLKETDVITPIKPQQKKPLMHYILIQQGNQLIAEEETKCVSDLNSENNAQASSNLPLINEFVNEVNKMGEDKNVSNTSENVDGATCDGSGDTLETKQLEKDGTGSHDNQSGNEADEEDMEEYESGSDSAASEHSGASNPSTPRKKSRKGLSVKALKRKKGVRPARKRIPREYKAEDKVPAEVIYTSTYAEVMWQDGRIESGIPSADLLPIHHLDDSEFFPGDFVIPAQALADTNKSDLEYGVIERVDHTGRTCLVKWMKPYEVGKSNKPDERIESDEVSVYDIRDHPDYKYRPGLVVVRIAGSEGGGSQPAGQVFELLPDGRLRIMWVDGFTSFAYPQELYLLGEEEMSELNDTDMDDSSDDGDMEDDSWETEEEEEAQEDEEAKNEESAAQLSFEKLDDDTRSMIRRVIETAKLSLTKIEEACEMFPEGGLGPGVVMIYKGFIQMYKEYKNLDSHLGTKFFDNAELKDMISKMRKDWKKEKASDITKHVTNLMKSVTSTVTSSVSQMTSSTDVQTPGAEGGTAAKGDSQSSEASIGMVLSKLDEVLKYYNIRDTEKNMLSASASQEDTVTQTGPTGDAMNSQLDAKDRECETLSSATSADEDQMSSSESKQATRSNIYTTLGKVDQKALCLRTCHLLKQQVAAISSAFSSVTDKELTDLVTPDNHEYYNQIAERVIQDATSRGINMEGCSIGNRESIRKLAEKMITDGVLMLASQGCNPDLMNTDYLKQLAEQISKDLKEPETPPGTGQGVEGATSEPGKGESESQPSNLPDAGVQEGDKSPGETEGATKEKTEEGSGDAKAGGSTSSERRLDIQAASQVEATIESMLSPQSPMVDERIQYNKDGFTIHENAPSNHKYHSAKHVPVDQKAFMNAVRKELKLLRTSLPIGIYVKGYEDRMDLFTVMIKGPACTPYEDGLFFFELHLHPSYPMAPPNVHYIAYCSERLNPNLYEDGKVCVSLLGTWSGRGTEVWTNTSNMLQVLISIQGLILVGEPYYNEAGYEKQKGSQEGLENSRMYNEMAILKLIQSMIRMVKNPPSVYQTEVREHMQGTAYRMIERLETWVKSSEESLRNLSSGGATSSSEEETREKERGSCQHAETSGAAPVNKDTKDCISECRIAKPDFPLMPASKGFCLSMRKQLAQFRTTLEAAGIKNVAPE